MKEHAIKTWIQFRQDIITARKNFEVRKDDRNYQVGDIIRHQFWNPDTKQYEGGEFTALIQYKLAGGQFGIEEGYCVLSTTPCGYVGQLQP